MGMAERIKEKRKRNGLNQVELANLIGVSAQTERRWEWGQRSPRAEELAKLASVLNTSVAYLMGLEDEPAQQPASKVHPLGAAAKEPQPLPESNAQPIDMAPVPIIGNIQACCGEGNSYFEDTTWDDEGEYLVPYADLVGYLWQVGKEGIRCIPVEGDSMEPELHNGDMVVLAKTMPRNGDIAIVKYEGRILARVFSEDRNGKILLHPLNERFKDIVITPEDLENGVEFGVAGKVFLLLPHPRRVGGAWL